MNKLLIIIALIFSLNTIFAKNSPVEIKKEKDYYSVILDFSIEKNHRKMGEIFVQKVLEKIPDYEKIVDS